MGRKLESKEQAHLDMQRLREASAQMEMVCLAVRKIPAQIIEALHPGRVTH